MSAIRQILTGFAIIGLAFTATSVTAATYKEKIHYEKISPAQPVSTDGKKVEVVEMFWYGCPHCNKLEPYVDRWVKKMPKNVVFVRTPAIFRPDWELHARAYYTAEILGVVDKTHKAMFDAIHGKRQKMNTEKAIMDLYSKYGVSNDDFKRVFKSFAVEAKVRRAKDMSRRYGIKGVPALIVNGKYRTGAQQAGGNNKIFKVVNYLVELESK
ncbi:MAG: thiol:disulfide interchange protein DsbA/DsbL [Thiohalomonadales bacterium]